MADTKETVSSRQSRLTRRDYGSMHTWPAKVQADWVTALRGEVDKIYISNPEAMSNWQLLTDFFLSRFTTELAWDILTENTHLHLLSNLYKDKTEKDKEEERKRWEEIKAKTVYTIFSLICIFYFMCMSILLHVCLFITHELGGCRGWKRIPDRSTWLINTTIWIRVTDH